MTSVAAVDVGDPGVAGAADVDAAGVTRCGLHWLLQHLYSPHVALELQLGDVVEFKPRKGVAETARVLGDLAQ